MAIINETEFAALIGCSSKTVSNLIAKGMPATGGGKRGTPVRIDTGVAVNWFISHHVNKRLANADGSMDDITSARLRKLIEEHRGLKLDNDASEARLLPADQVRQAFKAALAEFNSLLDGAAQRMARGDAVLSQMLLDEHDRIRDTFSRRLSTFGALSQ